MKIWSGQVHTAIRDLLKCSGVIISVLSARCLEIPPSKEHSGDKVFASAALHRSTRRKAMAPSLPYCIPYAHAAFVDYPVLRS